jgi:hypothetical protein
VKEPIAKAKTRESLRFVGAENLEKMVSGSFVVNMLWLHFTRTIDTAQKFAWGM